MVAFLAGMYHSILYYPRRFNCSINMTSSQLALSRRIRSTPFESRVLEQGPKVFSVYNHMTLSSVYRSPQEDYEHLCTHVQLWDVSAERQVEVVGPDALALVELITPRDISRCAIGQCVYAPLVDEHGGIVNDPIILRLADDRFWVSIADSDVLLWLKGITYGSGMEVKVFEPDVSPLAVQGPKADDLMTEVVGPEVREIKFFRFIETEIVGTPVYLARSGWSGQGGFEIYLQDSSKGIELWDAIWKKGQTFHIRAGCPNLIERLESGLMSYGSDMTLENNPIECGLERFLDLDKPAEYMSREALDKINRNGVDKIKVNLMIEGEPQSAPRATFDVVGQAGVKVGIVTSLAYSKKYGANLAFAIVNTESAAPGCLLKVVTGEGERVAIVKDRSWR